MITDLSGSPAPRSPPVSVITPFFFGTVAGGDRLRPGAAVDGALASWVNPTSLLGGVLAVAVCAYLAAVFLTADAPAADLVPYFRQRASDHRRR